MADEEIFNKVVGFYNELTHKCDFLTNVNEHDLTAEYNQLVKQLHPETMKRYYGSGIVIPEKIQGMKILDIGCGSGSLVFILSKLVGPEGYVVGVDITPNLIDICKKYSDYHREKWGYSKQNFEFHVGNAEKLHEIGLKDNSFDLIVSNGVFCLCPNKQKVFAEAYRLLKVGGEFYLNDVYADKPAPEEYKGDIKLWDLGLTGSQVWSELVDSAQEAGFTRPYLTCGGPVKVIDKYKEMMRGASYCCAGNRMFKLKKAQVTYKGDIKGHEKELRWDINMTFQTGKPKLIDTELAFILKNSRFADSFEFQDSETPVTIQKAQNPFGFLDDLAAKGKPIPHIYTVE